MKKTLSLIFSLFFLMLIFSCGSMQKKQATTATVFNNKYFAVVAIDGKPVSSSRDSIDIPAGYHTLTVKQQTQSSLLGSIVESAIVKQSDFSYVFEAGKKYNLIRKGGSITNPSYYVKEKGWLF